jgi:hypothetical protein
MVVNLTSRSDRLQNSAHDFPGQRRGFTLQASLGRFLIFFNVTLRRFDLRPRPVASLVQGGGARLQRSLAASLLRLE